jgi:hypothetical protein
MWLHFEQLTPRIQDSEGSQEPGGIQEAVFGRKWGRGQVVKNFAPLWLSGVLAVPLCLSVVNSL